MCLKSFSAARIFLRSPFTLFSTTLCIPLNGCLPVCRLDFPWAIPAAVLPSPSLLLLLLLFSFRSPPSHACVDVNGNRSRRTVRFLIDTFISERDFLRLNKRREASATGRQHIDSLSVAIMDCYCYYYYYYYNDDDDGNVSMASGNYALEG